ncbi:hypothetical protein GCM10009744_17170 [Kribbella alba]|uniref:AAA+ ATPase domain-containing protein n=1 Tax=Kribbella alba TaxID=190197 RepID=A0ABP4QZC0_9ACTN
MERFARGRDGGVDLRWTLETGDVGIAQCKHYPKSSFSQLLAAAREEVPKLANLEFTEYKFITSQELGVSQKEQIYNLFSEHMRSPQDVYSGFDVDQLVARHPEVERRHVKLWLASGTQLFWATHSELANRSEALRERLERTLHRYVDSTAFGLATRLLSEHKVCLIAGEPGIGKTVLARMLVAEAIARGFEPVEVSMDIDEAWAAMQGDRLQVFLYDDFLGKITFSERMGKNEDARLSDFIGKVSGMESKLLIMTTREYILRDARRDYRQLERMDRRLHFLLELEAYSRLDKARILYNHIWHADISRESLRGLADGGWSRVVDHPNYSPRLIEYCTRPSFGLAADDYLDRFVDALAHPEEIWSEAYDRHLTEEQRALLVVVASFPAEVGINDLQSAHFSFCAHMGIPTSVRGLRASLEVAEGTFVALSKRDDDPAAGLYSPSVGEFLLDVIANDHELLAGLVRSAMFFEQLSTLATARTGGVSLGRRSTVGPTDALPLDDFWPDVAAGFTRTFDGPTPDRILNQTGYMTGYEPPFGYLERRLLLLLNLPAAARPDVSWINDKLRYVADRWKQGKGWKPDAVKLVQAVGREDFIHGEVKDYIKIALESWLSGQLSETTDWNIYLDYLQEDRGVDHPADLAIAFEEHSQSELDRWDPSPPDLDDLIYHAQRFGLDEVTDLLREKASEDEEREEARAGQLASTPAARPRPGRAWASDADIEAMFSRLAQSHG